MKTTNQARQPVRLAWLLSSVAAAAVLVACSGGGGEASTDLAIDGFAATGAALGSASVSVRCATGTGTATTNADGSFTLVVPAPAVGPCLIQVRKGSVVLHSVATASGRVNVTPITELLVAKALGGDPATAFADFNDTRSSTLKNGLDAARAFVRTQVAGLAGGPIDGDPLTKRFVVGDADDRLLDNLAAVLASAGKSLADLRTAAVGGTDLKAALPPEETRQHDTFAYAVNAADAAATTFAAMAAATSDTVDMSTTTRLAGVLGGAAYRIEVPAKWNGELVMYTHGYAGEGLALNAVNSSIRRHLIQNGYAWAASSYSKNSYDVRAGVEDTNKLALNFNTLTAAGGRTLDKPSRNYIIGHSMGGHIAAAAVEAETMATANNKMRYDGSMPMCGVVGDTKLFDTFSGMQAAAHVLGGSPTVPLDQWNTIKTPVTTALFGTTLGTQQVVPNGQAGLAYYSVLQNLTGGPRPLFDLGYAVGGSFGAGPYPVFGTTTVSTGLTTQSVSGTTGITYTVDGNPTLSAQINAAAPTSTAGPDANRLRRDGLRWIPKVNGQLLVPVLSMHTLGDVFVPFNMQQVYRQRVVASGNGDKLVQRAMRGATHCDFTNAEMAKGFTDLVAWVKQGTKPAGDDVLTAATVADVRYGCAFTNDTLDGDDGASTKALRGVIASTGKSCSATAAVSAAK